MKDHFVTDFAYTEGMLFRRSVQLFQLSVGIFRVCGVIEF